MSFWWTGVVFYRGLNLRIQQRRTKPEQKQPNPSFLLHNHSQKGEDPPAGTLISILLEKKQFQRAETMLPSEIESGSREYFCRLLTVLTRMVAPLSEA